MGCLFFRVRPEDPKGGEERGDSGAPSPLPLGRGVRAHTEHTENKGFSDF